MRLPGRLATAPVPMAGLALGIGSLGWCWENTGAFDGKAQMVGALVAGMLLLILVAKFILHPRLLWQDLAHPLVGSVVPTFAMATMVVSHAIGGAAGYTLWAAAVLLHLLFLAVFLYHRLRDFKLHDMVPSWFVPPVGIIVAAVAHPQAEATALVQGLLWFGIGCYALMLPVMLFRLIFGEEVPDAAKPTIAILAAPASLSLVGYLTVVEEPSLLLVSLLLGIAMLMTLLIYLSFLKLLRLEFSPGYAAFTFPMVIGATAIFKASQFFQNGNLGEQIVGQLQLIGDLELTVATLIVCYVSVRYLLFFNLLPWPKKSQTVLS